jgi:serralysin
MTRLPESSRDLSSIGVASPFLALPGGGSVTSRADVPASSATTVVLDGGASDFYTGVLETVGDRDWIRIELAALQAYDFTATGTGADPLIDPYLRLYTENGTEIASDDDSGPGAGSKITFVAPEVGVFYLEVAAYDDASDGSYTLYSNGSSSLPAFDITEAALYLWFGNWHDDGVNDHRFDAASGDEITINLTNLTLAGRGLARAALDLWSDVTGLVFEEQPAAAQITFDDLAGEGAYSSASWGIDGFTISATVNVDVEWLDLYGGQIGDYSFQAYVHEIGHALGLGHGGPYDGDGPSTPVYATDSWRMSAMSYLDQLESPDPFPASFAYIVSPQVADIFAIQALYGAPTTRPGDTVYGYNSTADRLIYDASIAPWPATFTIFDSGGADTLDYSGFGGSQTIRLEAGSSSSVLGLLGNVSIALGVVIENAIGGSGADLISGNEVGNTLVGGPGDDLVFGGGRTDRLIGGDGADALFGGDGRDLLYGDDGEDLLEGGDGGDHLSGRNGADTFLYGGGPDTHVGGAGSDTLDYSAAPGRIVMYLDGREGTNAAAGDTALSVENLIGTLFDDRVDASTSKNAIFAGAGDDRVFGRDGNDTLDGGGDDDELFGQNGNDALYGQAGDDLLDGGAGADRMYGGNGRDVLLGGSGNDRLYGQAGNDVLEGGAGDDQLHGQAGDDRFVFAPGWDRDTIFNFETGAGSYDVLDLSALGSAFNTFGEVMGVAAQAGLDVLFNFGGGDEILVLDTTVASFHQDDFLFA